MKRTRLQQPVLTLLTISTLLFITSCKNDDKNFDATGSFEAVERVISSEAMGKITTLDIEEGQTLKAATPIGQIDVSMLTIQAEQVEASISAIKQKTGEAAPQVDVLKAQLITQRQTLEDLLANQVEVEL